jgi:excisionase family DNA binding protein
MSRNVKNSMMTTSEVAKLLYVHINTVRRWSDQGILKPYRIGPRGDRRFMRDDIMNCFTSQQYDTLRNESRVNNKIQNVSRQTNTCRI